MDRFQYFAPSEVLFGRNAEAQAGSMCKKYGARKVLVHYGGESAKRSGLLDRVCASLAEAGLEYVLLGGVVPNPLLSKVYEGAELCRKEKADFILAVGGGSVIDSAKGIGYALANEGDVWDYYAGAKKASACAPLGVVLTLSATGSEMSNSSVITKDEGMLKRGMTSDYCYPKFSLLNPELTYTLPAYQTACGCTDIILHTLERYFTAKSTRQLELVDGIAATLMRDTMRNAKIALREPDNYDARAEIMWCGTLSHNGITGDRPLGDWACHQLEHELSGMFGVAHGAGLAAIWGTWARYVYKENPQRFAQLAVDVFNLPYDYRDCEKTALAGIAAMESFFRHIGMPTNIRGLIGGELTEAQIGELAYKCSFMGKRSIGQFKILSQEDMANIYRLAK